MRRGPGTSLGWRLAATVLGLGSALGLTACTVSLFPYAGSSPAPAPTAETAARLAEQAVDNWGAGAAEQFQGTLSASGISLSVDVNLAFGSGGAGLGSGTANNTPFQYLSSGQASYLKGQSFWQSYYSGQSQQQLLAKGFQENYAVAAGNNVALAIGQLPSLAGAVAELSSDEQSVERGAARSIDGRPAVALSRAGTTWWVTQQRPVVLVGLRTPVQGGLQDLDLTMRRSNAPADLTGQLGTPVDPNDPATMPALYQVVNVVQQNQGNCTDVVCGFNVTVVNQEGTAAGPGVVTVATYADQSSTAVLADCTVDVPTGLGTNQSAVISCGVSGPGWEAYAASSFYVRAAVTSNPPYV